MLLIIPLWSLKAQTKLDLIMILRFNLLMFFPSRLYLNYTVLFKWMMITFFLTRLSLSSFKLNSTLSYFDLSKNKVRENIIFKQPKETIQYGRKTLWVTLYNRKQQTMHISYIQMTLTAINKKPIWFNNSKNSNMVGAYYVASSPGCLATSHE